MIRPGTFWSGLTTATVLAIPWLAGLGWRSFQSVYESAHFLSLCAYGLAALLFLLNYRYFKARVTASGLEVEAGAYPDIEEE